MHATVPLGVEPRSPEALNATGARADTGIVFRPRQNTPDVRVQVMTLPDDYLVRRLHEYWAVVGPTGVWVVGRADGDVATAALRTAAEAHLLRTRLADVVPWSPFVNAVVVADRERNDLSCTVVEIDRLEAVITDGHHELDGAALGQLRHHLPGVVQRMEHDRSLHTS
jgi:hypothetical protein